MGISQSPDRADVVESEHRQKRIAVSTSAVAAKVDASEMEDRQIVYLYNHGPQAIYWGDSNVSVDGDQQGVPLEKNQFVSLPFGNISLYLISTGVGANVTVGEIG